LLQDDFRHGFDVSTTEQLSTLEFLKKKTPRGRGSPWAVLFYTSDWADLTAL
jgi:hypothetical protein